MILFQLKNNVDQRIWVLHFSLNTKMSSIGQPQKFSHSIANSQFQLFLILLKIVCLPQLKEIHSHKIVSEIFQHFFLFSHVKSLLSVWVKLTKWKTTHIWISNFHLMFIQCRRWGLLSYIRIYCESSASLSTVLRFSHTNEKVWVFLYERKYSTRRFSSLTFKNSTSFERRLLSDHDLKNIS